MAIRVSEFKFRRDKETPNSETILYIFLPLPLGLTTTYSQQWNNEELPLGLGKVLEVAQESGVGGISTETLKKAATNALSDATTAATVGGIVGKISEATLELV